MRAFIAMNITEDVRDELCKLQSALKRSNADVKWVGIENMHITLKFLGDISDEKIETTKQILDSIGEKTNPFIIRLSDIGCFPSMNSPRVIWVGVKEGADKLKAIADELESAQFHPHMTIGRVRSSRNKEMLVKFVQGTKFSSTYSINMDRLILFQSTLTPKGPIYTPIHIANFKSMV